MRSSGLLLAAFLVTLATDLGSLRGADDQAERSRRERPNIVLIVADDLGYGELGCYGQQRIRTPNLDRLAAEGIRFTQHYAGQAVCAPSRCSLMSGVHQGHAFIRDNGNPPEREQAAGNDPLLFPGQHPLPADCPTIARVLRQEGYATAAMGKWGLGFEGSSGDPSRHGFELFYGYLCQVHAHNHYPRYLFRNGEREMLPGNEGGPTGEIYSQDRFIEEALAFLDSHAAEPFFLYLPLTVPHLAIQVPEDSLREYTSTIVEEAYEHRGYFRHATPRAGYAAMISHLDRGIGSVLERLESLGIADNTLVIFTSDNGPTHDRIGGSDSDFFQSSGPLSGRKGSLREGGIRVPFIARWPAVIASGRTSEHVCAFWDYFPTLCEVAGVEVPAGLDGISFLPTLAEEPQRAHEFLYWEFPGYGGHQAVRLGNWKALREKLHRNPSAPYQLYDLVRDPGETVDLAAEHPDVVRRIAGIAAAEHRPSTLFPMKALDEPVGRAIR